MAKKDSKAYAMSIQEILYLNSICKENGYSRENIIGVKPGTFSSIKVINSSFDNDDINNIKNKFYKKYQKRLNFSGGTSTFSADVKIGYFTKLDA